MNLISQNIMSINEISFFQNNQDIFFMPELASVDLLLSPSSTDFTGMMNSEYNFMNTDMRCSRELPISSPTNDCFSPNYQIPLGNNSSDDLALSSVQHELINQLPSSRSLQAKRVVSSKSYSCPVCQLNFSRKNSMNRHVLSHINVRPYTCIPCNRSFKRADIYRRHCASNRCQKQCSLTKLY